MSARRQHRIAVALQYDSQRHCAPRVSVRAECDSADQVVKLARRFGVAVVNRPELARALVRLASNQEIPPRLFEAVAVVLNELDKVAIGSRSV